MIFEFTAAKIAEIAFGGMIEGGAGKLTEIAIEKLNLLRQKIWNQLWGNPEAERAIKAVEQGSKSELVEVTEYLQACMDKEPTFAQEIQALAREINDSNLEDNSSMNQSNYDSSKGYQVKADTVGHIGDVIHNP
ncbi:hypothetical protein NDI44_08175 [Trichocoleus sp. DQ-A3]|uniref:hypothetical protein n=1 Tax=Cyanophyceae TaxID=3028117 RepID=UPI0018EF8A74|nr:hypothetical protein [Coleofasciculus sp. FACHB-125]